MIKLKRLLQVGIVLIGFVSTSSWAIFISGGTYDGADVGSVDTLFDQATKVELGDAYGAVCNGSSPECETTWINDILGGGITFTVKESTVAYYSTDASNTFAFMLENDPEYFLVKNSTHSALYANNAMFDWGVFSADLLSDGFNLPSDGYTISHVSEFNGRDGGGCEDDCGEVPEPAMVGLLAIGLLGMVVVRRRTSV